MPESYFRAAQDRPANNSTAALCTACPCDAGVRDGDEPLMHLALTFADLRRHMPGKWMLPDVILWGASRTFVVRRWNFSCDFG
jgi:hypothetical protein